MDVGKYKGYKKNRTPSHMTQDNKRCIEGLLDLSGLWGILYGQYIYADAVDGGVLKDMAWELERQPNTCTGSLVPREAVSIFEDMRHHLIKMAGGQAEMQRLSSELPVSKLDMDDLTDMMNAYQKVLLNQMENMTRSG